MYSNNSLNNCNIITDYNIKESKCLQTNLKKIPKNKFKFFYIDSNELTKDETSNKVDKNIDNKIRKNKIILLKEKNNIKIIKYKKYEPNNNNNKNKAKELNIDINKKYTSNNKNFKYFNKNDINSFLNIRLKTLDDNADKLNKIKFNSLNKEEINKKYNDIKNKSDHKLSPFNENDLYNKIKKIKFEKYIINCYKTIQNTDNKCRQKQHNHSLLKNNNNTKNIPNSEKSKIKAYAKLSKIIKSNIIDQKKNYKRKKIEIKQNYIINKNLNHENIYDNYISTEENINKQYNTILDSKNSNFQEKIEFDDIPQRRPGCKTEKNMNVIYKNNNNIINRNERKKYDFIGFQPKTTFTKSMKITKLFNNNKDLKEKVKISKDILNSIFKKFQTQRFKNNSHNKVLTNKKLPKSKDKDNIKYLNLKQQLTNNNNNKLIKYLNKTFNEKKTKNDIKNCCISIKNKSFSFGST